MKKSIALAALFSSLLCMDSFAQKAGVKYVKHVVEYTETVYSIPVHYNMTTPEFLSVNNFDIDVVLKPGQEVLIREMTPAEMEEARLRKLKETPEQKVVISSNEQARMEIKQKVEAVEPVKAEPVKDLPVAKAEVASQPKPTASTDKDFDIGPNGILYKISKTGFHLVEKKQTIYHLSQIYNVPIEELKRMNNLATTDISIGQKLKVSN